MVAQKFLALFALPQMLLFWLSLPPSLDSMIQGCAWLCGALRLWGKEAMFIDGAGFELQT